MTEAATPTAQKAVGLLDDVVVKKPQHSDAKTRKYLCSIKSGTKEDPLDWDHLDLQIRIGSACFARRSYVWEGAGQDAKQVFLKGMLAVLTDDQFADLKRKLQFLYARKTWNKKGDTLIGLVVVDASDAGGIEVNPVTREETIRGPREKLGRTVNGDIALKDVLLIEPAYESREMVGRVVTLAEARETVRLAEEEAKRELEVEGATFGAPVDPAEEFEAGKGGKGRKRAAEAEKTEAERRTEAALLELSNQRPQTGATQDTLVREGGVLGSGPKGKSSAFGGGRIPEGK